MIQVYRDRYYDLPHHHRLNVVAIITGVIAIIMVGLALTSFINKHNLSTVADVPVDPVAVKQYQLNVTAENPPVDMSQDEQRIRQSQISSPNPKDKMTESEARTKESILMNL